MSDFPGTWTTLYNCVDWLSASVPFADVPFPSTTGSYPSINLLRIDLGNPKITTYCSSKADLSPNGVVLSAFLKKTFDAANDIATLGLVGINANFFDNTTGNKNQLHGLAISNGDLVSPTASGSLPILFTKDGRTWTGGDHADDGDIWTAVSGSCKLIQGGKSVVDGYGSPKIAARTAIGISRDPNILYLLTVDGLEDQQDPSQPYYGATFYNMATLLLLAGATEAINMDGGGSTTMGRCDKSGCKVMNKPHADDQPAIAERPVGNCFAVIVRA